MVHLRCVRPSKIAHMAKKRPSVRHPDTDAWPRQVPTGDLVKPQSDYDEYASAAEFYDFVVPYRERQDVSFFVEMAREAAGPVLEIGCGTGRVLIPTARAGVEIVGMDSSSKMLAVCREKLELEPEEVQSRVRFAKGDMRRFDLNKRFHLVTIPFRPFQHLLSAEDQMGCLACIHRHLFDQGKLVLDVFNPSLPHLAGKEEVTELMKEEPEFTMPDGPAGATAPSHRVARLVQPGCRRRTHLRGQPPRRARRATCAPPAHTVLVPLRGGAPALALWLPAGGALRGLRQKPLRIEVSGRAHLCGEKGWLGV